MSNTPVSVQLTGGAGFLFEDQVAAYFLASMLSGAHPYGTDLGSIAGVSWQVGGGSGWLLEDLAVSFLRPARGTLAVSIKSNKPVTGSGFPAWFIEKAWDQFADASPSAPFQRDRDLLCLAVGEIATGVREAWHTLLREARTGQPARILQRYATVGESNETGRRLLQSLAKPGNPPTAETVRFLCHLRLLHFDFQETGSTREALALWACQEALRSGQATDATALWQRLVGLAEEHRATGGWLDLAGLLANLRGNFDLKDRIDHTADWSVLERHSLERTNAVKDSVANSVSLVRQDIIAQIRASLAEGRCVVLAGDGGSGKSGLARRIAVGPRPFGRCLWLDGASLDFESLPEVERHLGLRAPLHYLLATCAEASSCLVLDGLETFSSRATDRAAAILATLAPNPTARGWTVLVTTRAQAVDQFHQALGRAGISPDVVETHFVHAPSEAECREVIETSPRLNAALVSRELRAAIRNLKLLDWIVTDARQFSDTEVGGWVGLCSVLDSLWKRWVGTDGASAVRAGVMKRLAELEGRGLQHGIGTSELDSTQHAVLGQLELLELLNVTDEKIWFRHEMLGDWARLRLIIEQSAAAGRMIAELAQFPRWHDAIRLYGQRVLETDPHAPKAWVALVKSLAPGSDAAIVARDMLLEGLFSSEESGTLLDRAWAPLCEDGGALLRRLLSQFLHAATVPDPRLSKIAQSPSQEAELAPHLRFPWWPLWPGTLAVLARHADDVVKLAPLEASEACALWLRSMPVGMPGRHDAAVLALAIGREVQEAHGEGLHSYHDHADKTVFEAVLLAAPELPEDVSALCLELSRRRPEPPAVTTRAKAHEERVRREQADYLATHPERQRNDWGAATVIVPRGPLREQFPDGPAARVDDGLQRAVFETQGTLVLASTRPEVAREVLLACSLEAPRYEEDAGLARMLRELGVEDPPEWHPPMFIHGPWLLLLRQDPQLGVDCIVRIVNHATLTWENRFVPPGAPPEYRAATRVAVVTSSGPIECIGGEEIYGWFRDRLCGSSLVASSLMALERYLYERLDQDLSVDEVIRHVLASGRSVSLLAVLVAAGQYRPSLFTGPLAPLLGTWQLYGWNHQLAHDDRTWQLGLSQWARRGQHVFDMVRDWHTMPHRKRLLRDCAVRLMLSTQEEQELFAANRARWRAEIDSDSCADPDLLEELTALLDPGNYRLVPRGNDRVEVCFEWPPSLKSRIELERRKSADGLLALSLPFECRRLLDAAEPLPNDKAEAVWSQLRSIAAMPEWTAEDDLDIDRRPDALLGGIAALRCLAPDWLSADSTCEEWCANQIALVLQSPPNRSPIDTDVSISTDRWHSFLAEIAVADFTESPLDPDARAFVANASMSSWYATIAVALLAAYRNRGNLGREFNRLVNLSVLWAAFRGIRMPLDVTDAERRRMVARRRRLVGAFVRRRIPADMMDWEAISARAVLLGDRLRRERFPGPSLGEISDPGWTAGGIAPPHASRRRRRRSDPGFDIEALRFAFAWLSLSASAPSAEREESLGWLRNLLGVTLRMLPAQDREGDDEIEGTPYPYDRWILEQVAVFVARSEQSQQARELWRPILELGPNAHYWTEDFLGAWTTSALQAAPSVDHFFARWREMIEFACTCPAWMPPPTRRRYRLWGLWEHLLGMDIGASVVAADGTQAHFDALIPLYRRWADAFLNDDQSLRPFLHLLSQDGARPLLCPSMPWLLRAAETVRPLKWNRDPIADEVASVMRLAWKWHADRISTTPDLLGDFFRLLNLLVTQQSPVAMDLRKRVSRTNP